MVVSARPDVSGVVRPLPLLALLLLWHLCPSSIIVRAQAPSPSSLLPVAPLVNQSEACSFCILVVQTLDDIALSNSSIQNAISAVQPICNQLPPTPQAQCQSLVQQFAPIMLKLLVKLETPSLICTTLGICNATTAATVGQIGAVTRQVPVISAGNQDDPAEIVTEDCTLCRYVIATLSAQLEDPTTQKQFLTAVADAVCSSVSQSQRTACEDLIISQGQNVVFLTLKNATPQIVCSPPWLSICPANVTMSISP